MDMISEQVKELEETADRYGDDDRYLFNILCQVAGTIETLSTRLEDIERIDVHYNGKWILCENKMPEVGKPVLVCDKQGNVCIRTITCKIKGKKYWSQGKCDVVAWQPLPEPYNINIKNNNN